MNTDADYQAQLDADLDDLGGLDAAALLSGVDDHLALLSGNLPGVEGMGADYLENAEALDAAALAAAALAAEPTPVVVEPAPVAAVVEPEPTPAPVPAPKNEHMIPKSRLDQEIEKRRVADARALELENQLALAKRGPSPSVQLPDHAEAMKLYQDAILDGQHAEAARIMNEIRIADATIIARQAAAEAQNAMRMESRATELQTVVDELEATHDVLNAKHENFNKDLTDEVLDLHQLYMQRGYQPAAAMKKAAEMVLRVNVPAPAAAPALEVVPAAPVVAAPTAEQALVIAQRDAQARLKAAQLATQPTAEPTRVQNNAPAVIDIMNMSDEDFANLPESKIRELRGDFAVGRV